MKVLSGGIVTKADVACADVISINEILRQGDIVWDTGLFKGVGTSVDVDNILCHLGGSNDPGDSIDEVSSRVY